MAKRREMRLPLLLLKRLQGVGVIPHEIHLLLDNHSISHTLVSYFPTAARSNRWLDWIMHSLKFFHYITRRFHVEWMSPCYTFVVIVLRDQYRTCSQKGRRESVHYVGTRSTVRKLFFFLPQTRTVSLSRWAVILAFDVSVDRDAQLEADKLGVKIMTALIIYHLQDKLLAYRYF